MHSTGNKRGWNYTHTTRFHNRGGDNINAFPVLLLDTRVYWTQVYRRWNNDADDWFEVKSDDSADDDSTQAPTRTNASFKGWISANMSVFADMVKKASNPDLCYKFEKLATLWKGFSQGSTYNIGVVVQPVC